MSELSVSAGEVNEPRRLPAKLVPCAQCGSPVDPLRAPRVAIIRERFRYFCGAECREHFDAAATLTPLPRPRRRTGGRPLLANAESAVPESERLALAALASVGAEDAELQANDEAEPA